MTEPNAGDSKLEPMRPRGFLVGLFACVPISYATANLPQSSMFSLLAAPIGFLILLAALNALATRIRGRPPLRPSETALVFAMASVCGAIAAEWTYYSHSAVFQLPFLAPQSADVAQKVAPQLPDWLVIKDLALVRSIVVGEQSWPAVWRDAAILAPRYAAWGALMLAAGLACLCANSLLRTAWVEKERLAFPVIQLPLALSQPQRTALWGSSRLWIAFGIVFAIDLLNGFNYLYPNLPSIPLKQLIDTGPFLKSAPWSAMGEFNIGIYPFLAALGVFMPADLLFSLILFFLLRKATHVGLALVGIEQNAFSGTYFSPGAPYFEQQAWGGVLALFVSAMYFSRSALRAVWNEIRSGAPAPDGGWSSRGAALGFVACGLVVIVFGALGALPIWTSVAVFSSFMIFSVVLARLRAQLGPPTHEFAFFGPTGLLTTLTGGGWMSGRSAVWLGEVFLFMNRIARTHPAPSQLEGFKLAKETRASARTFAWGMAIALVVGFALANAFYVEHAYRHGSGIGPTDGITAAQNVMQTSKGANGTGAAMMAFGALFAFGLDALRLRFPSLALHPAGYVLGITYGIDYYWFGLALALVARALAQRYGGIAGLERVRAVALGVMLGEYSAELIWMAVALITKQSTYTIGFNDRSLGAP